MSILKMAHLTITVIGSMPKPEYLQIPCYVKRNGKEENKEVIREYNEIIQTVEPKVLEERVLKATKEIVSLQEMAGIDVITDGEIRRETYIFSFCRRLNGFDFENLKTVATRNGAWVGSLPRIVSKVSLKKGEVGRLADEWCWGQKLSKQPMKITIPGPMTIIGTTCNEFYKNEKELCRDLVKCINLVLRKLADVGCKDIQVMICQG